MPRLPDAYDALPTPQPTARVLSYAGTRPARAMGQLGQTLGAAGEQLYRTQTALDAEEMRRREQQVEIETAARKAADKATATARHGAASSALEDLYKQFDEEIANGTIDKTKARELWVERSAKITQEAVADLAHDYREPVSGDLAARASRLENRVGHSVLKRDQADVLAGINQTIEYAKRHAVKEPAQAIQLARQTAEQLGPFAGLNQAQISAKVQDLVEGVAATRAYTAVNEARRDNRALAAVEKRLESGEFADLEPQAKAQLLARADGYRVANIHAAEAAERRAIAREERNMRIADSALNAASTVLLSGRTMDDKFIEDTIKKTALNPPALAAFKALLQDAGTMSAWAMQPIAALDKAISDAKLEPTNPSREKRINAMETIRNEKRAAFSNNPILAAQEYGGPRVTPIDSSTIDTFVAGIDARGEAAAFAESVTGKPVSPLMPHEATALAEKLRKMPTEQKEALMGAMAAKLGPRMIPLLKDVAKDAPRLAVAGGLAGMKTTFGNSVSRMILEGDDLLQAKQFVMPEERELISEFNTVVGDAIPTIEGKQAALEAAKALYAKLRSKDGVASDKNLNRGDWGRALRMVTGGTMELRGRRVLLTGYAAKESDSRRALSNITPEQVKKWGGVAGMTDAQAADYINSAPLESTSVGRYKVLAGGSILQKPDGSVFEMVFQP